MTTSCFARVIILSVVPLVAAQTGAAQTQFKVLHTFKGGADGIAPYSPLVRDAAGNLYGTTAYGGGMGPVCGSVHCGTVFKLSANGTETVLHRFSGGNDGSYPSGTLALDPSGGAWRTAASGIACCIADRVDKLTRRISSWQIIQMPLA